MSSSTEKHASLSIEIKSDLSELAKVRQFCGDTFQSLVPEMDCRNNDQFVNLQLALNEAVANVMEHGYEFATDRDISCFSSRKDDNLEFRIEHDGHPFAAPDEIAQIDQPLEGGMGLFLIQQCVDQVSYCQTVEGRQCIRLTICIS